MAGHIEQRIDLEGGHALGARGDLHDLIASFNFALCQHSEIEAGSTMRNQQRGHLRFVHTNADAVAGDAWLRYFEQSAADPVTIADAHLCVRQPALDGEILPELPIGEVLSTQVILPIAIGVDLIDEHRPVLAAMASQIPLSVAADVESAHHARSFNWRLPNGSVYDPALPRDVARQTHVD